VGCVRFLRVANASDEEITVFVRYYMQDQDGDWNWYPAAPQEDVEPLTVTLEPGQASDITDSGWRVNASKVRVWATSASGKQWRKFRDANLTLVGTDDNSGERTYVAKETQMYSHTFRKQ
jgi:hypothetical protein